MTKSSGKPDLGSPTSKLEGVDKTAQKVMTGDMQKGGNKMGKSMKKEAKDKNLVNEVGDGKVDMRPLLDCCGYCTPLSGNSLRSKHTTRGL